jgi:uncharacterized protein (DUF952 family)
MTPKHLYKILDSAPPEPLPDKLASTSLDTHDGFIHLSTAEQTPITAKLFFSGHSTLWVLKLDAEALDGRLEFLTDPKAGITDGCAHVHESQKGLGRGNIVEVVVVQRGDGMEWTNVEGMKALSTSP